MSAGSSGLSLKCPVCGAGFRSATECPRCRTDLSAVMRLAARAYHARQAARSALLDGDVKGALHWQAAARRLHRSGPSPLNDEFLIRFAESADRMAETAAAPAEAPVDRAPAPPPPAAPVSQTPPPRRHVWERIASWFHRR